MKTVRKLTTLLLAALIAAPTVASADGRHLVDPGTLSATIARHAAEQDADRAAIREALAKPQVRDMADRMGFDIDRAAAAIDTLSHGDLGRAGTAARQVNQQL